MPSIQKSDVIGAITVYLLNENRPCPAHYLVNKFGDDVGEVIAELKKDNVVIGKRGRGGGIVFPDTVFHKKEVISSNKIKFEPVEFPDMNESHQADTEMQLEEVPF